LTKPGLALVQRRHAVLHMAAEYVNHSATLAGTHGRLSSWFFCNSKHRRSLLHLWQAADWNKL